MATDVKLPRLGQGMESGVIVRWLKSEGEPVTKGEPLYELDTDKVTQEVESELDGVLTKIVVPEGDVEVGATVAVIESNGAAKSPDGASARSAAAAPPDAVPAEEEPAPVDDQPTVERPQ
ncbi:MAG: biotin/lipoyl-containing protein, partial [Gaiella sp.]|uniref:biotin/lipoyl-containing protein n=1 Tax=Gaiella sp. TaxID=2663207 RepID=UPI003C717DFB